MSNNTLLTAVMIGIIAIMAGFFLVPGIAQEVNADVPNDPPLDENECAKLLAASDLPSQAQQIRDTFC